MFKTWTKKMSQVLLLAFSFMLIIPASLCLASETDVSFEVLDSSRDGIYPADWGKQINTISMDIRGSFDRGDIITLTLSQGVCWYMDESSFDDLDIEEVELIAISSDKKTIKVEIDQKKCDEIEFAGLKVATTVDVPRGDIVVTVGGDFSASLVVGEIIDVADINAEVAGVFVGEPTQAGDIVMKENFETSLAPVDNLGISQDGMWYIGLLLPEGVSFTKAPHVYVNDLNVKVDCYREYFREDKGISFSNAGYFQSGDNKCYIKIKEIQYFDKEKKDTIRISNLYYEVAPEYREGDIPVEICGDMVNKYLGAGDEIVPGLQSNNIDAPVYKVINATSKNWAPVHGKMTMGKREMTINDKPLLMDAVPYIKDGHCYLPVRYAAYALDIDDSNIEWDQDSQTAALTRDPLTVSMQVGSSTLLVDGVKVEMDTAPELRDDRVCLPIRYVAEAFGADVEWDALTRTVTIDLQ